MSITEVSSEAEFDTLLSKHKLVIVDFYTDWCGPCKAMAPIYKELSEKEEYQDILFLKVNTEENQALGMRYQIRSIPTVMTFLEKDVLGQFAGFNERRLLSELNLLLEVENLDLVDFRGAKLVQEEVTLLEDLEKGWGQEFGTPDMEEDKAWGFEVEGLHVTTLYLNKVTEKVVLKPLSKFTRLLHLSLANLALEEVPQEILGLATLEILDLSGNRLKELPDLSALQSLKILVLNENLLEALPASLAELTLRGLDLRSNSFNSFPSNLPVGLELLSVADNPIGTIPSSINQLTNLGMLDLTQIGLNTLPDEVRALENLERLFLGSNNLEIFPPVLTNLPELKMVVMANNKVTEIGAEVGEMSELRALDISQNPLKTLPQALLNTQIVEVRTEEVELDQTGQEILAEIEKRRYASFMG